MAVRHHAFGFDGAKYLDAVARAVGCGPQFWLSDLADEARRVAEHASAETKAVLEFLRFESNWLVNGPHFNAPRLLVTILAEHLQALPSLSGREQHAWLVLDRIAPIAGWNRIDAERLVRGVPLSTLPEALGRLDLMPLFQGAMAPGGVLAAPVVGPLVMALDKLEDRFRNPRPEDAVVLSDWLPATTYEGLARVMSNAFDDASAMLRAANGRSMFLLFE